MIVEPTTTLSPSGNILADLKNITQEMNRQYDRSALLNFFPISVADSVDILLDDGGLEGKTYQATYPHNIGYAPAFRAFVQSSTTPSQYSPVPDSDWLNHAGASVFWDISASVDASNLYASMFFHKSPNPAPFFDAGTTFTVFFYIFSLPMPT